MPNTLGFVNGPPTIDPLEAVKGLVVKRVRCAKGMVRGPYLNPK